MSELDESEEIADKIIRGIVLNRFQNFAKDVMASWPEGGIEGDDLQEIAVKYGLLTPVIANEPCGEECWCQETHGEFPTTCYRKCSLLK